LVFTFYYWHINQSFLLNLFNVANISYFNNKVNTQ
jgi:hypothetical protein